MTILKMDMGRAVKAASLSAGIVLFAGCVTEEEDTGSSGPRPTAQAGADLSISTREYVLLNASGSRNAAGGESGITYQWQQISGPAVTFDEVAGAETAWPVFIAPWVAEPTALVFEVTVSENGLSDTDEVVVVVQGCQIEVAGTVFSDCLAEGFGPLLSYEADGFGNGGVHYDGNGDYHVQWALLESGDPEHQTVIEVRWNANDPFEEFGVNGWFGITADNASVDLSQYENGALQFDMRVMNQGAFPGRLVTKIECTYPCTSDEAWVKEPAELGQWQTYTYSMAYLRESGLDATQVSNPFLIMPAWGFQGGNVLQIDNIRFIEDYQSSVDNVPDASLISQQLSIYENGFVDSDADEQADYLYGIYTVGDQEHLQVSEVVLSDNETVLQLEYTQPASQAAIHAIPQSRMPSDFSDFYYGNIVFDMKVVSYGGNEGFFEFNTYCLWPCKAVPWYNLGRPLEGEWTHYSIPVAELVARGVDLTQMFNAFLLGFSGAEQQGLTLQLNNIHWQYSPQP